MNSMNAQVEAVRTRQDFVAFVRCLDAQLREHPEQWPNSALPDFLEAMAAWVEDMHGFYEKRGTRLPDPPGWKAYAEILAAARVYE